MPNLNPYDVMLGSPRRDNHRPDRQQVARLADEMIDDTAAAASTANAAAIDVTELTARMTRAEGSITSDRIIRADWQGVNPLPGLFNTIGEFDGQGAEIEVMADGTHGDATETGYDGPAVQDAGLYMWHEGWRRWKRIGDNAFTSKASQTELNALANDVAQKANQAEFSQVAADVVNKAEQSQVDDLQYILRYSGLVRLDVTGGTGDVIEAERADGQTQAIDYRSVLLFRADADSTLEGPTIEVDGVVRTLLGFEGQPLPAGALQSGRDYFVRVRSEVLAQLIAGGVAGYEFTELQSEVSDLVANVSAEVDGLSDAVTEAGVSLDTLEAEMSAVKPAAGKVAAIDARTTGVFNDPDSPPGYSPPTGGTAAPPAFSITDEGGNIAALLGQDGILQVLGLHLMSFLSGPGMRVDPSDSDYEFAIVDGSGNVGFGLQGGKVVCRFADGILPGSSSPDAPQLVGAIGDQSFALDAGDQTLDASGYFSGTVTGYSVTGPAVINAATGVVTIATDTARTGELVTVTATNSAGSAQQLFLLSVNAPVGLLAPVNLFSAAQASFDDVSHIDDRGNWEVVDDGTGNAVLQSLQASANDVRLSLDAPLVAGRPYVMTWDKTPGTTGTYKAQLSGDGSVTGIQRSSADDRPEVEYFRAGDVSGNFIRAGFNPSSDLDARFDNVSLYDLSGVDPTSTVCDVVIVMGDSNSANATSDFVTAENNEYTFDPSVWYMPCLRGTGSFNNTGSLRHIPQPLFEPAVSTEAQRMSPLGGVASQVRSYSAERGRPLLVLAMGDPGSGLNGTEDWRKTSDVATTGARMYGELLAMKAALDALGPDHEIIGACVSLGANDFTGADYATSWAPAAVEFVANVRTDLDVPNIPIIWAGVAADYEVGTAPDYADGGGLARRAGRMRDAQASLDQDSGSANAIAGVHFVPTPGGNTYAGNGGHVPDASGNVSEVHFNAHGMQVNGRAWGAKLVEILTA